jgi:hypothetical protein
LIALFSGLYAAIAAAIALVLGFFGGFTWALNAVGAAFGSYCVVIAAFVEQRKLVLQAAQSDDGVLSAIDDKEELYKEDEPIAANSSATVDQAPNAANGDDQNAQNKIPLKTKATYALRSFAPTILIAYGSIALIFFALHSNGYFAPAPFLIGLSALPISALAFAIIAKGDK